MIILMNKASELCSELVIRDGATGAPVIEIEYNPFWRTRVEVVFTIN